MKKSIYEIITERIVSQIEETGILPWKKPWKLLEGGIVLPRNVVSNNAYRGINVFLLAFMGFESPYWLTYHQCSELGGQVKKGEKGVPIIYWKLSDKTVEVEVRGEKKEKKLPPIIRYSTVFNVEQCEELDIPTLKPITVDEAEKYNRAKEIVSDFTDKPRIETRLVDACYYPQIDAVYIAPSSRFESVEEYYSTLFHELIHSTGHSKRLDRKEVMSAEEHGIKESYGKEELVAEIGSSFLCAEAGIAPVTLYNSVSYLRGWIDNIKANPKMVIDAASRAQKASDWILKRDTSNHGKEEETAINSEEP